MALTRRSTIGSIAGLSADIGRRSLKRSPAAARTEWLCRSTPPRSKRIARERRKRGECEQAIGRSRGGRTTKIHALSDPDCKPCAFHLTPGQAADIAAGPALLKLAPPMSSLIGDKGYDGGGFRAEIVNRGAKPVIPNKSNRVTLHSFSKRLYKGRNVIERCFCRLKDFRRVATRYDKLARNFLAAVHLAALVAYWDQLSLNPKSVTRRPRLVPNATSAPPRSL